MSPTSLVRDAQISAALINISRNNSSAIFTTNNSHSFAEANTPIEKGVGFSEQFYISNRIVERHDEFTIKFNTPGVYRIDYSITVFIHQNNTVPDLQIQPSVSNTLTEDGKFEDYASLGIKTTRKTVQISANTDKVSDHAVDSIYDSCVYRYDGNGDIYFKLLVWGPNTQESYIVAGATLFFTYLSS